MEKITDWIDIATAPKDGELVYVKRVHNGSIVKEGSAVFTTFAETAPIRSLMPPDPLGRETAALYARMEEARENEATASAWLNPDRRYRFPEPTHWSPKMTGELRGRL